MKSEPFLFEVVPPDMMEAVRQFSRSVYQADLGHVPLDRHESAATYFVALDPLGAMVASFRMIGPDSRPFDLESEVDLGSVLGHGARPALVGRLCVHPSYRAISRSIPLHSGLLALALSHARSTQISHLVLYTYSNLLRFYRAARFIDAGVTFNHAEWGNVHLMHRCVDLGDRL